MSISKRTTTRRYLLKLSALWTIGLFSSLGLAACSGPSSANKTSAKIILTGSSTVAPLAAEIGKQFEAQNPDVRVDVQTGGSSRGIADARQGVADLGMISRSLKPEETDLQAFPIALDGIGIIVHKDNPVGELTDEQIQQIYTGEIGDWADLGGKAGPISVVNKAEGRSTLELFLKYFDLVSPDIKADVVIGDNEQGIKTVAGNVNSIGYVSIGAAENSLTNGTAIKLLPVNGIEASTAAISEGTFPISRELNLVTPVAPEGEVKAFVEFAQSAEVNEIIEAQYFVVRPSDQQ